MRLPDFLIVGVAKSGTTSLADWLREHPAVFMPPEKELYFFCDDARWREGLEGYGRHFAGVPDHVRAGEATPVYLSYPEAVRRIAATLPAARLIAILRDPVERTHSSWRHRHFRSAAEPRPFDRLVADEIAEDAPQPRPGRCDPAELRHVAQGRYAELLSDLFEHVPRERVLVLLLDDLEHEPAATFRAVCRFLELDDSTVPAGVGGRSNAHREFRPVWLWDRLVRHRVFERLPDRLATFIATRLMMREDRAPEAIEPATRAALERYFAEPNRELGALLGRELPWTR